ncbi:MAG: hypothetical protein M1831_005288 [Alyxoria varia]|nr:MAG: hypothetical protein M1831_005288 [Alyxoria varia]
MAISAADPAEEQSPGIHQSRIIVSEIPKFDLESYISNYDGATRLDRLICIGTSSKVVAVDALKLALTEAKKGKNVRRYLDIAGYLQKHYPKAGIQTDQRWVEDTKRQVAAETERLEGELKGYKNNLIKESIRMGQEEIGAHYLAIGDLGAALHCYHRMREYCTTTKHISEMNLKIIITSIRQGQWLTVSTSIQRVQGMTHSQEDANIISAIAPPLLGLASLCSGDYRSAAQHLTASKPDFMNMAGDTSGSTYLSGPSASGPSSITSTSSIAGINFAREAFSPNDVAVYGALCALATYDRHTLQSRVLESQNFRSFLELESHLRRAIAAFVGAKYTEVLNILELYRPDYLLDVHLQRHVHPLWELIRKKCMVAYFEPFSRVDIKSMVAAFGSNIAVIAALQGGPGSSEAQSATNGNAVAPALAPAPTSTIANSKKVTEASVNAMATELISMIESHELHARIDLVDGILIATNPNDPSKTSSAQQSSDGKANDPSKGISASQSSSNISPSRTSLLKRALNVAYEQEKSMRLKLFHTSLVESRFFVSEVRGSGYGMGTNAHSSGSGGSGGARSFFNRGHQGKQGPGGRDDDFSSRMKGKGGGVGGGVGGRAFEGSGYKSAGVTNAGRPLGAPFQGRGEGKMEERGAYGRPLSGLMDTSESI